MALSPELPQLQRSHAHIPGLSCNIRVRTDRSLVSGPARAAVPACVFRFLRQFRVESDLFDRLPHDDPCGVQIGTCIPEHRSQGGEFAVPRWKDTVSLRDSWLPNRHLMGI